MPKVNRVILQIVEYHPVNVEYRERSEVLPVVVPGVERGHFQFQAEKASGQPVLKS